MVSNSFTPFACWWKEFQRVTTTRRTNKPQAVATWKTVFATAFLCLSGKTAKVLLSLVCRSGCSGVLHVVFVGVSGCFPEVLCVVCCMMFQNGKLFFAFLFWGISTNHNQSDKPPFMQNRHTSFSCGQRCAFHFSGFLLTHAQEESTYKILSW